MPGAPITVKAGSTRPIIVSCHKGEHIITGGYSATLPAGAYIASSAAALTTPGP